MAGAPDELTLMAGFIHGPAGPVRTRRASKGEPAVALLLFPRRGRRKTGRGRPRRCAHYRARRRPILLGPDAVHSLRSSLFDEGVPTRAITSTTRGPIHLIGLGDDVDRRDRGVRPPRSPRRSQIVGISLTPAAARSPASRRTRDRLSGNRTDALRHHRTSRILDLTRPNRKQVGIALGAGPGSGDAAVIDKR